MNKVYIKSKLDKIKIDEILKIFTHNGNNYVLEVINDGSIIYADSEFYWTSFSEDLQISIDTVENILKDMEMLN